MSQVAFEIPEEILFHLGADDQQASTEVRMMAAVKLFELGRLSSGAAAELAGVPKPVFLAKLADTIPVSTRIARPVATSLRSCFSAARSPR